jgi:5-oxoprolinase (ATP-hydrolysing)
MIEQPEDLDFVKAFVTEHEKQFGFNLKDRLILCDDIRVRSVGHSAGAGVRSPYAEFKSANLRESTKADCQTKKIYFEGPGYLQSRVIPLSALQMTKLVWYDPVR